MATAFLRAHTHTHTLARAHVLLNTQGLQDDDSQVATAFLRALARPRDARLLDELKQCSGCKCCGHESGIKSSKASHGRGGCRACGTSEGCTPKPEGAPCQCEFHR